MRMMTRISPIDMRGVLLQEYDGSGRQCREPGGDNTGTGAMRAYGISCQAKGVNSGVRPAALDRKTETGEGRLSSMETIGVFIAIPITDPGGGRIMARDVAGRFAGELIGRLGNFVVGFEQRQNVRNSAVDVVDMMNIV